MEGPILGGAQPWLHVKLTLYSFIEAGTPRAAPMVVGPGHLPPQVHCLVQVNIVQNAVAYLNRLGVKPL